MNANILEINIKALRKNISIIKAYTQTKFCFPVKANAYGHGLDIIVKNSYDLVDYFAVACLSEAIQVYSACHEKPILVFGRVEYDDISKVLDCDFIYSIHSIEDIRSLSKIAKESSIKVKVHININTGMNRMGVGFDSYKEVIDKAYNSQHIELLGVYSHFACADDKNHPFNLQQNQKFKEVVAYIKSIKENVICHLANSYGLVGQADVCYDMVRPGILSYGFLPEFEVDDMVKEIQPIARLTSEIIKIISLNDGDSVGYSLLHKGFEGEYIATIPIGYGDGFFRALGGKGFVTIDEDIYPIVGKMSMDAMAISLGSNHKSLRVGNQVEIISNNPSLPNSAKSIAKLLNTIEYDVAATLNERIVRIGL